MKTLLSVLVVLAMTSLASASTVTIQGPAPGEPGSAENPLQECETAMVVVISDTGLLGLDAILSVSGLASITDALKPGDAAAYGWDPGFPCNPIYSGNQQVEIGGGNFSGNYQTVVGYIIVHCDGADPDPAVVSIFGGTAHGGSMDVNYGVPTFVGTAEIHQIPEPMTVALLGLGGLFLLRRRK